MQEKIEDLDDENRCKEYYDGLSQFLLRLILRS